MSILLPALLRPWWLLAMIPLVFVIWRLWRASNASEAAWRKVIDAHLLPHLLVGGAPHLRHIGLIAVSAGSLIAVLALAGPALHGQAPQAYRSSALRVIVVDLSADMTPYLEQVKPKILDLLRALPEGQTALLVYAGEPYLVVPPTSDVETIALFVPELETGIVPVPGNRPDEAMRMAGKVLERNAPRAGGARDIVWISASDAGIAAVAPEGARLSMLLAAPAAVGTSAALAPKTNGIAVQLRSNNEDIDALVARLARGQSWIEQRDQAAGGTADAGYWLVLALLPFAAFTFRRGVLALLAGAILLAAGMPQTAEASGPAPLANYQGWQLFRRGEFAAAATRFADPRWRAAAYYRAGRYDDAARVLEGLHDADALYNRGNALARQGQLTQALAAYEASLALRPHDPDTLHNRDLVHDLLNRRSSESQSGGRPTPPPPTNASGASEREAGALAEQWLRGVPDAPGGLLHRKLQGEHRRRRAGEAERAW